MAVKSKTKPDDRSISLSLANYGIKVVLIRVGAGYEKDVVQERLRSSPESSLPFSYKCFGLCDLTLIYPGQEYTPFELSQPAYLVSTNFDGIIIRIICVNQRPDFIIYIKTI